jgi:hypothetical protein
MEPLARLPEAEQQACRQFWSEVAQLLERAAPKPARESKPPPSAPGNSSSDR